MDRRLCPRCGLSMQQMPYEDVSVDMCQQCWGTWLDRGELQAILASRKESFSKEERQQILSALYKHELRPRRDPYLKCPDCQQRMEKRQLVPNVELVIDTCKGHGVWLDTGELKAAQIFAEETDALSFLLNELKDV